MKILNRAGWEGHFCRCGQEMARRTTRRYRARVRINQIRIQVEPRTNLFALSPNKASGRFYFLPCSLILIRRITNSFFVIAVSKSSEIHKGFPAVFQPSDKKISWSFIRNGFVSKAFFFVDRKIYDMRSVLT